VFVRLSLKSLPGTNTPLMKIRKLCPQKFYNIGSYCQCYKTLFVRNLQIRPPEAFKPLSDVCG